MRMIVNIFYPDCGEIRLFGDGRPETSADLIGYLPEERGLYQKMTVQALLEFYGELRSGHSAKAEVAGWLERLGLANRALDKVETLSKGMSQKVQFIASVIPEPKLLILDEPLSGLDPVSADAIRSAILDLRRRGVTVILSTHDMQVAESMCDYILMIFRGRKVLDGTLSSIQDQYGEDTIHVTASGGLAAMQRLPGVDQIRDLGQIQELRLTRGADPQEVLRALVAQARVTSFSLTKPSLHDIFMRIAGPAAEEANHANA
jgi:ABC-2 type transport system ATP-binding protein